MTALRWTCAGLLAALPLMAAATPAAAAPIRTELAGNPLGQYPSFEYVRAFNANAAVQVAIDPARFPEIVGKTCDIYVVNAKSASQWSANLSLADVTGGVLTRTFVAGTIQANAVEVAAASQLNANAGTGLGVAYDVVLDCDRNGQLGDGDYVDGMTGEAGFYVVHDTTAAGPLAVTQQDYNLPAALVTSFDALTTGERLYYPNNVGAMGRLPLVVISHGAGHDYRWYDHIGRHLASYGYVVMSHDNDIGLNDISDPPPLLRAWRSTIGHTDAFLAYSQTAGLAGGALINHVDSHRIVWIGHSRGAEGVAMAYDRMFDGVATPTNFSRSDVRLVSSMLPTDWDGIAFSNPHDANYHLWTASGDSDVNGSAGDECDNREICQTFHLVERATRYRQSTIVQATGHGWFHDADGEDPWVAGPPPPLLDEAITHRIQLGYLLPLIKHYVEGNVPALDFLTRQYESFRPIGVSSVDPRIVVTNEYRNGADAGNFVIDDYQTESGTGISSSGGSVDFDVANLIEGRLDDNNLTFEWMATDPFNGATQAGASDTSRGVVFDWTGGIHHYEWRVPVGNRDFTRFRFLSLRGAQGTRHPNTLAETGDLTFSITLRDVGGATSSINIGAYGGGLEEPYARSGGWHNEMETIRIRTADFLTNGAALDLTNIAAVGLEFGTGFGSPSGRIVIDDLMLTNDVSPLALQIVEPTTAHSAYAGTSEAGSRVLVRVSGGNGLDLSPGNLTVSVAGIPLTAAQIPTAAASVGGETWIVIAPGARPAGCYDLAVALTAPAGVGAAQPQSLCYNDNELRRFDRVLAIDQTRSMLYDSRTALASPAKMEAARAAGRFFVDLSNPLDRIGVVAFQRRDQNENGTIVDPDELAEVRLALTPAGEGMTDQRPAVRALIGSIGPDMAPGHNGMETSPGAALTESRVMLDTAAAAGQEPNIVLLTDGLENYPPFWSRSGPGSPLRDQFAASGIRIDAVGVGLDADDVLLQDVADATGGEFTTLNEGSGSFFLLSRLADWYKAVDEDVRGEQRFYYAEGYPPPGGGVSTTHGFRIASFEVEPGLDWMTVAFHANVDNAATVELFAPGSSTPVVAAPPTVTVRADAKHSVYRIDHPAPGTWSYMVQPHGGSAEFFAVASAPTLLAARVGPRQIERRPDGTFTMPLRVWIADTQAALNAAVTGEVRRPDGVHQAVVLRDDGASLDGAANDGIYGLAYGATIPGPYYVHLKASGTSNAGRPYERYLATAFVVPGLPERPLHPGEGLPGLPAGGFCGCGAETRVSLAAYAGLTFPHGAFNAVADSSSSFGLKAAVHFPGPGGSWSAGLYLGRDNFSNSAAGGSFHLTHLSPEIEFAPRTNFCPRPALHAGAGLYRDETGNTEFGFNLGASLSLCLSDRLSLVTRYDYRRVPDLSRTYSTLQAGLRFSF